MNILKNDSGISVRAVVWGCLAIVILLFVVCGLSYWLPQLLNNMQLKAFADHLYEYPLPPHSEVVSQYAEVGLMGNGNHCDFVVKQTTVTYLSQAEIETYYEKVTFPPVNNHNESASPEYQGLPIPVIVEFTKQPSNDGRLFYTLILLDIGYDPGFDMRCH